MNAIAAEKIKVFDQKGKSVGMVALSEVAFLETWADIFTRTGIKNHPGSLLALADEHMEEMKLEKTKENYRIQKPAIVSKAINRVIGYNPGKDFFLFSNSWSWTWSFFF